MGSLRDFRVLGLGRTAVAVGWRSRVTALALRAPSPKPLVRAFAGSRLVREASCARCAGPLWCGCPDYPSRMAGCTAPREGHRTASGRANCPVCGGRGSRSSYSSYSSRPTYGGSGGGSYYSGSSGVGGSRRTRTGATVSYTPTEWRTVEPWNRKASEQAAAHPERRDLFLCHAWADREGSAKDLYGHLKAYGASVWFSEEDLPLGALMIREIDKGLRNSRVGIVLVTPELLASIEAEGVAEKELAVLLSSRRVIPVLHGVTFEELNDISPMLASHAGLSTKDSTLDGVAAKVAAAAAALPAA